MTYVSFEGTVESDLEGYYVLADGIHWRHPEFFDHRRKLVAVSGLISDWQILDFEFSREISIYLDRVTVRRLEVPPPKREEE